MKIRFISFALAGVMTLGATTGCRKDKPVEPDPKGRVEVNLKANIKPPSKLKVANNQWEASDRVGLFMKQAGALTMESVYEDADNLQMSIDGQTLKSVSPVYYPLKGNVDFIAYYPYITSVEGNYTVPVNVAEQAASLPVEVLYSNNATNKAPVEAPVMLDFRFSLAKIIVHVTGDNLTTSDLAGMSVSVGNMYTKAWLQLINGTFAAHQGKADIALYRNTNASTAASAVFEALLLPTLVAEDVTYTFTVNGEKYTLALENESYAAATQYELFVNIDAPAPQRTVILLNATITPRTPGNSREFSIGNSPLTVTPAQRNLLFSADGLTVTSNGQPFTPTFTVTANEDTWDAVCEPAQTWITVTTSATGFSLSVAANANTEPRSATITVSSGDNRITIDVTQLEKEEWKNVTGQFLLNTQPPFEYGEMVMNNRFYHVVDWKTNEAGGGNGNVDTYWNPNNVLNFVTQTSGYPVLNIVNGKMYQTIELEAGTYRFDVDIFASPANTANCYIVAALGNDLPDTDALSEMLNYQQIKASVTTQWTWTNFKPGVNINSIEFDLSEKSTVSLGFLVNMTGNMQIKFYNVELWSKQ